MSIVRAKRPDSGFTIVDNDVIRDERISWRARGILIGILSRPDNWRTDSTQLASEGREGREAVRAALRELEACGYLVRTKECGENGRWVTITTVYDTPQGITAGHTEDGFPGAGSPGAGKLGAVRSTQTKNQEEDEVSRVADPQRQTKPRSDWRGDDRKLWADTIGANRLASDGSGPWKAGTWTTAAFYDAFRKGADSLKAKRWPGIFLSEMDDWEDYLSGLGLEVVPDQGRRGA